MSGKEEKNDFDTPKSAGWCVGAEGGSEYVFESVNKGGNSPFMGFASGETAMLKRILMIERKLDKWINETKGWRGEAQIDDDNHKRLRDRVERLEQNEKKLIMENAKLREEVIHYKNMMKEGLGKVEKEKEDIKELVSKEDQRVQQVIRKEVHAWKTQSEEESISFKEVMEKQLEQNREDVAKEVIGVLKQKETLVGEIAEKKKSVIVFGLKENKITYQPRREKELKSVRDIMKNLNDEERASLEDEVDEIHRLGQYKEGTTRPVKVLLKSQCAAEDILYRTTKLKETAGYENIYIKRNRNEEERRKHNELLAEAREKNNERSEEEKKTFFWKVVGDRVKKWYVREKVGEMNGVRTQSSPA